MARDIPLGNGRLLVTFDANYAIRDLYWPHVGMENHVFGRRCRVGFRVDDRTLWADDPEWMRTMSYEEETLVTNVRFASEALGLAIVATDAVDHLRPILLRRFEIANLADRARPIRVFLHHDLQILESDSGDTAHFDHSLSSIIHYKRRRYFLIDVQTPDHTGVVEYSCGKRVHAGGRGTAGQAEDEGVLDMNPIAQGAVDSTVAIEITIPAGETRVVHAWLAAGTKYQEVAAEDAYVRRHGADRLSDRTRQYWRTWVQKVDPRLAELPAEVRALCKRSLLVIRTQVDDDGAILAANDSDIMEFARDTYSYMWPRDGALVADALDRAGFPDVPRRFFRFCKEHIASGGYFLHKYNPDGSLASSWHPWVRDGHEELPIQEDETALVLWALERHFQRRRSVEFINPLYARLIRKAGDFMASFRDPETGLPLPTWDLWEERHGVHTFTVAAVHAGLLAAARFAEMFGEPDRAERYRTAAAEIVIGLDRYLFHEDLGRYARTATRKKGGYDLDMTLDASLAGLFLFGVKQPGDPRLDTTLEAVRERLWVETDVGGCARYENDYYHQVSSDVERVPGNPWFVCTLWLAEWEALRATNRKELDRALPYLAWAARHALPSGTMPEQVHPETGAPLSVNPLTWSHAGYLAAACAWLERYRSLPAE